MKDNLEIVFEQDIQNWNQLLADVIAGLSKAKKTLPCKWLYDAAGSALFEEITKLPEYYLTRVETRLLESLKTELAEALPELSLMIEPGSGSSNKTRILLASQTRLREYVPMDISAEFLVEVAAQLQQQFRHLKVSPLVGDFTDRIEPIASHDHAECLIFFPGSTIGNFDPVEARDLLRRIRGMIDKPGYLLIGVDMTQDVSQLLAAYNDAAGITAMFNLNLLARINRELGANFDLDKFSHRAIFNPDEHRIEMHLVSNEAQEVEISGLVVSFEAGETIHTENCYKYPGQKFEALLNASGWQVQQVWKDQETSGFGLYLLKSDTA
ncbi:MAG: L-histidine N(alpha)-methyltransferase [Betaproteobacteria bacterium HGW-Betaproteobacteria-8]|nr:MAG: L-histidine N(alpha)-methyltransferase [Betaproteobacteria bacterium HGW-Betaproteobacteria-8]